MYQRSSGKAYLFAILAVLFWATSPTAFKLGLRYQDGFMLLARASVTSAVILGIILIIRGKRKVRIRFSWKYLGFSALMGILNPVAYYLILFKAYGILPAQVAQPLNMIWPIVLVLISIPLLGQRINWKSIGAMCLSFSGVVVISWQNGTISLDPVNRLGVILALSTSVIWAFYFLYNARDKADPVSRLFLNFLFASVYLLLAALLTGKDLGGSAPAWGTAIYVGIFEMGVTFVLWLMALQHAPATDRISNLVYIAPFLNLFIVNRVLGEEIYLTTLFGIVLLVSGILIQNRTTRHVHKG